MLHDQTAPSYRFQQLQQQFAAHIRSPERQPIPDGIEARRMAIYEELFFNNVEGILASGFPVIRTLYSEEKWHQLVRDFFHLHPCKSPYFSQIPYEFVQYLMNERDQSSDDPPFLLELAHYEWVELELSIDPASPQWDEYGMVDETLHHIAVLSPLVRVLSYHYPVQMISAENAPVEAPPQPTYLLLYRDRNHEIHFMESNPLVNRLVEWVGEGRGAVRVLLIQLAEEFGLPADEGWLMHGKQLLDELAVRGVILGYQTSGEE